MGLPIMNNFLITLNHHCFICLKPLGQTKSASSTHSLQYLSRFLKLDLKKLVRNAMGPNHELTNLIMTDGEMSRLMVELCEGCASLNSNFGKLFRQLEKIKMEFTFHLSIMQRELLRAGEIDADKSKMIRGLKSDLDRKSKGQDGELERSLAIADILRRETIHKCAVKLKRDSPRIVIRKLAGEMEVLSERSRSTSSDNSAEFVPKPTRPLKTNISKHRIRLSSGRFKCKICLKELSNASSFHNHYQASHLKVTYNCNICSKAFSRKGNLKAHQESIHIGLRFFCKICSKSMSSAANLTTHLRLKKCHQKGLKRGRPIKSVQIQSNWDQEPALSSSSNPQVLETAVTPHEVFDYSYHNIVPKSEVEVHEVKNDCLNLELMFPPQDADVDGDVFRNYLGDQSEYPIEELDPLGEPPTIGKNNGSGQPQQPHNYS